MVAVMVPNAELPSTPFGAANAGVLVMLKTSVRNSRFARSERAVRLMSARSASRYAGPRTGLRELLPRVKIGAAAKAPVLKNCAGLRREAGRFGSPMIFGRWVPKPAKALK